MRAAFTPYYGCGRQMDTSDLPMKRDTGPEASRAGIAERSGWAAIEPEWIGQAEARIEGQVQTERMHFIVGDSIGIVTNYEVGSGPKGISETMRIRVTSTYRLEDGVVRMIGHHTDRF